MDEQDYWIPRTLDDPPLLFMWEMDIAFIVICCLILGGLLNMFMIGVLMAYVIARGYAYLKDEGGSGLIIKILFWYTPSDVWFSKRLPSHIREYIGG